MMLLSVVYPNDAMMTSRIKFKFSNAPSCKIYSSRFFSVLKRNKRDEYMLEPNICFYRELSVLVNRMSNALKSVGVRRGDRVAIYVPVSPSAVVAMLACARIGAIHSVVFAGFSAEALASRIQDAGAETVITADQAVRGGKLIELKKTVDSAVANCPSVKRVLTIKRTGNPTTKTPLDIDLDHLLSTMSSECGYEEMSSVDPLFMLYTSGSTGQPKGVTHSQAGYLLYTALTHTSVFGFEPSNDIFGCVADVGWITGHSYIVYGPLVNGSTTVLFESTPLYPHPGRYWETVQRLGITHFYGAPTALRMLLKCGDDHVTKYDRSSLKVLGTVGEPINHEAWEWYYRVVGDKRCPIIDTWWQTETGGVCIAPWPSSEGAEIMPAMPMRPMYGIEPVLMDENGEVLKGGDQSGALCLKRPWPGMATTLYGAHQRFKDTYFSQYPGFYFTGDGAHRDKNGHYQMTGRVDDVINVSGHRLGTAEIEDVLTEHEVIAEAAAVGFPHELKGQGVYAFVVLKDDNHQSVEEILSEARSLVKKNIASYAVPEFIQVCSGLPKTRSGKIMRRVLRNVAANKLDSFGDISTLAEPTVVSDIVNQRLNK
ncbi:Acetyl-coenzyme A synthetase 2-like, mitochondrial, variant 2 [Chamberlinius hualienensis]